jgi:hypothetical protein
MLLSNSKLKAQTLIVFAMAAQTAEHFTCKRSRDGSRLNKPTRHRERRSVRDVYMCLGSQYFRRAYRMSYKSFWELYLQLKHEIEATFKEAPKSTDWRGVSTGDN